MVTPPKGPANVAGHTPGLKNDGFSDIKKIVRLVLHHWFLFALSIPLFLGGVYIYHRYTLPVYKGTVTMLFKSESERMMRDINLMEGFGLSAEVRNIENQSFIIRSQKTIREVIDRLDFRISYFADGRFKDTELYRSAPFVIEIEENHPQVLGVSIYVSMLDNGMMKISASSESGILHRFDANQDVGRAVPFSFEKTVRPGELVEHKNFAFRIKLTEGLSSGLGEYFVQFHSHVQLTARYRSRVSVNNYREGSSIVFIGVTGQNPRKITSFLDVLSDVIVENNLKRKNDMASRSLDFIQNQLKSVADTLNQTQRQLMDFRKKNRFMVPSEFASELAGQFIEKEKDLRLLEINYDYFQQLKARLKSGDMNEDYLLTAFVNDDPGVVNQLVGKYMDVLSELKSVELTAGTSNPYYQQLEQELKIVSETMIQAIDKRMESIIVRQEEMRKQIAALSGRMNYLPELEKEYLELERAYKLNDAIYTFLLQKNSETQIAKASNVPDNEILDQATISGVVSPDKKGNYGKAFLLSLILPAAVIGLREMLNTRVRDKQEMETIAGDFPNMGSVVRNRVVSENAINQSPHSLLAESFRSLRTKIRFMLAEDTHQVILLTSTNTGEGKTFCALNLATVFAISGKKVALLGFDMRKPRLSEIFDRNQNIGISNYLSGQNQLEEIIYPSEIENMWVVPSGITPPNPSELIAGERTKGLFDYLRSRFDVIIVDTPPIGLVADARILIQYSDCRLFVVRAGMTNKEHFAATIDELRNENINRVGLVLNDINPGDKRYGYYNTGYYGPPTEDYK
ncbi:polysaccharide biosynthesis tyrosine autokinase [Marinilabilia sp.]|uniref:polysaccharide biosynthesis tyrosine autokinase n=1 Tax=Marinilabilia sp. TaxID=2021252 RepID=UPI0025C728C5|nr:tyrosine-protein kinase [Marinilabilia sp.]